MSRPTRRAANSSWTADWSPPCQARGSRSAATPPHQPHQSRRSGDDRGGDRDRHLRATVIDRRVLHRVRLLHHGFLGVGRLVLGSLLDVHLGRQRLDGLTEILARLLDVGLDLVDAGVRAGFGTGALGLAHDRASFTSLMSALTLSTLALGGGPTSAACLRLSRAAM